MQGGYLLDELVQSLKDYADYESLVEIISKKVWLIKDFYSFWKFIANYIVC